MMPDVGAGHAREHPFAGMARSYNQTVLYALSVANASRRQTNLFRKRQHPLYR